MADPGSVSAVVALRLDAEQFNTATALSASQFEAGVNRITAAVGRIKVETTAASAAASAAVEKMGADFLRSSERVTIGLGGISGQIRIFGQAAGAVAGALVLRSVFDSLVEGSRKFEEEVQHLTDELGQTSVQASIFSVAAKETNTPIATIDTTMKALVRTLNTNESAFARVGVAVRDANGNLLTMPAILQNLVTVLGTYEAGTNRLAAAQQLLGRSFTSPDQLTRFVADLQHASEVAAAFGVNLSDQDLGAMHEFQRASADMGVALLGLEKAISDDLRPVFDDFSNAIIRLGQEGKLEAWAAAIVGGMEDVGHAITDVSGVFGTLISGIAELTGTEPSLRGMITTLEAAAAAWIAFRVGLITVSATSSVLGFLQTLGARIEALTVAKSTAVTLNLLTADINALNLACAKAAAAGLNELGVSLGIATDNAGIMGAATEADIAAVKGLETATVGLGAALSAALPWLAAVGAALYVFSSGAGSAESALDSFRATLDHLRSTQDTAFALTHTPIQTQKHEVDELRRSVASLGAQHAAAAAELGETSKEATEALRAQDAAMRQLTAAEQRLQQMKDADRQAPPSKQGESEALKQLRADQADELALHKDNAEAQLQIIQSYLPRFKALAGEKSVAYKEELAKELDAEREVGKEVIAITDADAKAAYQTKLNGLKAEESAVKEAVKTQSLSRADANRELKDLADQEFAIKTDLLDKELAAQAGSVEKAHALMAQLAGATPEQQALVLTDVTSPTKFKELVAAWDTARSELEAKKAKIDVEFPDKEILQKAQEVRAGLDAVFGDFAKGVQSFTDALLNSANQASESLTTLRESLHNAQADAQYYALAEGRRSADFINAKNQEIAAQDRLNTAEQRSGALQNALAQAGQGLYRELINQVVQFGVEVIKMQAIQLAAHLEGNDAILSADKLSAGERLALDLGDNLRSLLGFQTTEAAKTTTKVAQDRVRQASEGSTLEQQAASWTAQLLGFTTQQTALTRAQVVGDQARVASSGAATAEKEAIETTSADKSILTYAAEAAAKVISAFADLPYGIGIALGLAAAGGVTALILGLMGKFEQGGDVADNMLGILHPDEMVLPTATAQQVRAFAASPGGAQQLLAASRGRGLERVASGTKTPLAKGEMVLPKALAEEVRAQATGLSGGASIPPITALEGADVGGDTLGALHEDEMVLPAATSESVKSSGGTGGKGAVKHEHSGTVKHEHNHKPPVGGVGLSSVIGGPIAGGGGASGGAGKIQDVAVVAAPATVKMSALGGHMETTVRRQQAPVVVTGTGGAAVATIDASSNTGAPKPVMVINRVPVTFTAIEVGAQILLSSAPFGIGPILGVSFGTIMAFKGGGIVPDDDQLAVLHQKEMVLPADIAQPLGKAAKMMLDPSLYSSPASTSHVETHISRQEELLTKIADNATHEAAPNVHVDYRAWDMATAHDQIDLHARHIAKAVAKQWKSTNPGRRR